MTGERTERPGARAALEWALARCATAHIQATRPEWAALGQLDGPVVVTGSGGSHPCADYIARALRGLGIAARSAYPLDAAGPESTLVAVTYSGSTPDICEAARRHRARHPGGLIVAISGHADTPIAGLADLVLCHRDLDGTAPADAAERGFMSIAATVAVAAATHTALDNYSATVTSAGIADVSWADETAAEARLHPIDPDDAVDGAHDVDAGAFPLNSGIHIVATGWAMPAALSLESAWLEGDLGCAVIHESKNLSHGRYMSVFDQPNPPTVIHIHTGPATDYSRTLADVLARHAHVLTVTHHADTARGGLAVLYAVQQYAVIAGERVGVDISRPSNIAVDGRLIHHWPWSAA